MHNCSLAILVIPHEEGVRSKDRSKTDGSINVCLDILMGLHGSCDFPWEPCYMCHDGCCNGALEARCTIRWTKGYDVSSRSYFHDWSALRGEGGGGPTLAEQSAMPLRMHCSLLTPFSPKS